MSPELNEKNMQRAIEKMRTYEIKFDYDTPGGTCKGSIEAKSPTPITNEQAARLVQDWRTGYNDPDFKSIEVKVL